MSEPNRAATEETSEVVTVKQLESHLFTAFPRAWAEPWDHVGLVIGDPNAAVEKVAFALDATADAVRSARSAGANVLVTHHPVCLEMPHAICPQGPGTPLSSACLWEAAVQGVALIAMHTNLDRSAAATQALPQALGLTAKSGIERGRAAEDGRLGSYAAYTGSLGVLANECRHVFGRVAQVYGCAEQLVERVAFFTGSLGDSGKDALACAAKAVVCGECGYHRALELVEHGCGVIILGHDVSELPLVGVLRDAVVDELLPAERCVLLDERPVWFGTDISSL